MGGKAWMWPLSGCVYCSIAGRIYRSSEETTHAIAEIEALRDNPEEPDHAFLVEYLKYIINQMDKVMVMVKMALRID